MHASRLGALIIDCKTDDLEGAAEFWAKALGYKIDRRERHYIELTEPDGEPIVSIQQVEHDSRIHLDIESDDREAEIARLESLGAKRVADIETWTVLEAPSGQRFCVVSPQRKDFAEKANRWD